MPNIRNHDLRTEFYGKIENGMRELGADDFTVNISVSACRLAFLEMKNMVKAGRYSVATEEDINKTWEAYRDLVITYINKAYDEMLDDSTKIGQDLRNAVYDLIKVS